MIFLHNMKKVNYIMESPQVVYTVHDHIRPSECYPHSLQERKNYSPKSCHLCNEQIEIYHIVQFKVEPDKNIILCFDCAKKSLKHSCRDCKTIIKWHYPMGQRCTLCFVRRIIKWATAEQISTSTNILISQ